MLMDIQISLYQQKQLTNQGRLLVKDILIKKEKYIFLSEIEKVFFCKNHEKIASAYSK